MNSASGGPEEEARVKPCLECGTILPFDARTCSLCGAPVARGGEEAVKPCMACEALVPFDAFYCPECGDFTAPLEGPEDLREPSDRTVARRLLPLLSLAVAWWLLGLGLALALSAAVWSRRLADAAA